jgi:hypothetical protein
MVKRKTKKKQKNIKRQKFSNENKKYSNKMSPFIKILSIIFFAIFIFFGLINYGIYTLLGAFILWVIFYMFFAEYKEFERKL